MLYRKLGKTNETVSALGFGCMRLPIAEGGDPTMIDTEKAVGLLRHAIDMGVNYIDTAYAYHSISMGKAGASEPFLAKALKNGYREKVKIATKLPTWLINTQEDMYKYLDEQLDRLEDDCIDFYLVHALKKERFEKLQSIGIGEFLDNAIKAGKIKYAGFSYHGKHDDFNEIVDAYAWSFCQIQYNYLDEHYQAGIDGLNYAAGKGLGIVIMEPLRGGKLACNLPGDILDVFDNAYIKRTPACWALKWVLDNPCVSVVLSGMNSLEQLEENLNIADNSSAGGFTEKDFSVIENAKNIFKSKIKIPCTECAYCMPCPNGVDIPANFKYYNDSHIWGNDNSYKIFLTDRQRASNCMECGACETNCPQNISIIEELKKVENTLGDTFPLV